jgi:hypothetical protein
MAHLFKPALLILLGLSPAIQADSLDPVEPALPAHDYTAVYQVLRNEKEVGEVTISLSHQDDIWTLRGHTHDMHGLAKMLKIKGSQTSTGKWIDGRFQPDNFKINFSLIGYKTGWDADFDWSSGVVTTTSKNRDTQLSLTGGATDPFSLSLNIRSILAESQTQMTLNVIDEDVIDSEVYAAEPDESFDSELGCLQTMLVSRIRKNKKRTSLVWYASDYDYVPVKMHHSKKKGTKLELQISSLYFDGQRVKPVDRCSNAAPNA